MHVQPPLIGLAHGSRHRQVGTAIDALTAEAGSLGNLTARSAFLDLTEPDLETVALALAAEGHREAVVVPLLFTVAFHATVDVPEAVREAAASAGIRLHLADILGTGDDVLGLLEQALRAAGVPADANCLLYAVGSSRAEANAAVADLGDRLAVRRGTEVRTGFGTVDPRADTVVADLAEPIAIVPLFLAPGLLLDPMRRQAVERGWSMTEPLGAAAAAIVLQRHRAALDAVRAAGVLG